MGAANHGVYAGIDPQQIHDDIQRHIHGSRRVSDREIKAAIQKALRDKGETVIHYDFKTGQRTMEKPFFDGEKVLKKLISQAAGVGEADISAASPINLNWLPEEDPQHLFKYLYQDDDLIFIGERYSPGIVGKTIRPASAWIEHFKSADQTFPHYIPNPLSGKESTSKDGKLSLRADACIKSFRFAVIEFDTLSRDEQLAFWWSVNLPVAALIDSGNKSIHGIVAINGVTDAASWTLEVENSLFKKLLIPLGVDGACRNEARLSRLPGHRRDNGKQQRLLYLAPEGRRVG